MTVKGLLNTAGGNDSVIYILFPLIPLESFHVESSWDVFYLSLYSCVWMTLLTPSKH